MKLEIKRFQLKKKKAPARHSFPFPQSLPASLHSEEEFVMLPALPLNDLDTST